MRETSNMAGICLPDWVGIPYSPEVFGSYYLSGNNYPRVHSCQRYCFPIFWLCPDGVMQDIRDSVQPLIRQVPILHLVASAARDLFIIR